MYVERLYLENIKLLADQEFSFTRADGSVRLWTVIVGENGVCKSTLLQAIALAASGPKVSRALVGDARQYLRYGTKTAARIAATFRTEWLPAKPGRNKQPFLYDNLRTNLQIVPGRRDLVPAGDADDSKIDELRAIGRPGELVVGYGVGRFLPHPGEVAAPSDPVRDRVEGLFDKRHKMLGTDFYKALREKRLATRFSQVLREVLLAESEGGEDRLLPWLSTVELRGKGGVDKLSRLLESDRFAVRVDGLDMMLPATSLSDGYQSMIAWIGDLLGHAFLDGQRDVHPQTLSGIVLLDEIDLHLHPTWQRRIVPILKRVFPRLQFIVTTHSPLVLSGFEEDEIIRLRVEGARVVQDPAPLPPGMLSASEVLSGFFDVPRAGRPELVRKERRWLELRAKSRRSAAEDKERAALEHELQPYWVREPDEEDGAP